MHTNNPYSTPMQITPMNMLSGRPTLRMCDMMSCCIEMRINCAKESLLLLLLLKPQQSPKTDKSLSKLPLQIWQRKNRKVFGQLFVGRPADSAGHMSMSAPDENVAAAYQNFRPMKQAREGSTSKFNVACEKMFHTSLSCLTDCSTMWQVMHSPQLS